MSELISKHQNRLEQIEMVSISIMGRVANLMIDTGMVMLVSFIALFRRDRQSIREVVDADEHIETFVSEHTACRHIRITVACLAFAVTITGCAISTRQPSADASGVAMRDATRVGAQLAMFLDNATTGNVATLANSPWGSNVSVHVRERYFAASGRQCMRLDVTRSTAPASLPSGEVTCLVAGDGWYAQRLVTEIIR